MTPLAVMAQNFQLYLSSSEWMSEGTKPSMSHMSNEARKVPKMALQELAMVSPRVGPIVKRSMAAWEWLMRPLSTRLSKIGYSDFFTIRGSWRSVRPMATRKARLLWARYV